MIGVKTMTDRDLALAYAPILHFDRNETVPLRAVGYTVFREEAQSDSFPKRRICVPAGANFVIEYAFYWDYDIGHMYDLEHIWVTGDGDGNVIGAEGSFHGKYLTLLLPELPGAKFPTLTHVHAFCQPGKHAFLPAGNLFRLLPDWYTCCSRDAGGPVLVGGPFAGVYAPTAADDARSERYIRESLAFSPTLDFSGKMPDTVPFMPWAEMKTLIPRWIAAECARLKALYGE